jgi:hypothetical protein
MPDSLIKFIGVSEERTAAIIRVKNKQAITVSTKKSLIENGSNTFLRNSYLNTYRHIPENSTINNRGHDRLVHDMD